MSSEDEPFFSSGELHAALQRSHHRELQLEAKVQHLQTELQAMRTALARAEARAAEDRLASVPQDMFG